MSKIYDKETNKKDTKNHLGEQLNYYRREHQLSLQELSKITGIDLRHLDNLETGKTNSDIHTLCLLANALGKKLRIDITD